MKSRRCNLLAELVLLLLITLSLAAAKSLTENLGDKPLFNEDLFQGDIAGIDPWDLQDRASVVSPRLLWPGGIVHYELTEYTEYIREEIDEAIAEYANHTCLKFIEKKPNDTLITDYVRIQWGTGCWSSVGRKGGVQLLSLGDGCHYKAVIMHELGHAIGLFHEHSRSDRDDYVEVIWANIKKGQETQFQKLSFFENNLLGENFDYKSIMLYDEKSFSKDGESTTMRVKTPGVVIGPVWKKPGFSDADIRRINRLYECFGETRPKPLLAPDFYCDFESDDCQFGAKAREEGFSRQAINLGGRNGTALVADSKWVKDSYLTQSTPMYPLNERTVGCFSLDYYMNGKNVFDMSVMKSGKDTTHVAAEKKKSDVWRNLSVEVLGIEEEVRFFINVYFLEKGGDGVVAIDNVSFKYQKC